MTTSEQTVATAESEQGGMVICRPPPVPYVPGETLGVLLSSDQHFGAATVDYDLVEAELVEAKSNGWRVNLNGDLFDGLIPKDPKRFQPSVLHPRLHGCNDILNKVVDWAEEVYAPYAEMIDVVGFGNHEHSLVAHHSFDPVRAFVDRLNSRLEADGSAHRVHYGGYTGFIDYRFRRVGHAPADSRNGKGQRLVIYFHHGFGSGSSLAASASGALRTQFVEGADVVWLGHLHSRLTADTERVSCPLQGHTPHNRSVRFVRTGAYYRPYAGQSQAGLRRNGRRGSYSTDSGMAPHGRGGSVLLLKFSADSYSLKVLQ